MHKEKKRNQWLSEFIKDTKQTLSALFFFAISAVAFWLLTKMLVNFYGFSIVEWFETLPVIYPIASTIALEIQARTFEGIILLFFFSSLFILPVPLEVLFISLIKSSIPTELLLLAALWGLFIGQHVNYFLGRFFGSLFKPYIKKKTQKKIKAWLEQYGMGAIFLYHLPPFPYPLANFIVGLSRYPYKNWVTMMTLSLLLKFTLVAAIISLF